MNISPRMLATLGLVIAMQLSGCQAPQQASEPPACAKATPLAPLTPLIDSSSADLKDTATVEMSVYLVSPKKTGVRDVDWALAKSFNPAGNDPARYADLTEMAQTLPFSLRLIDPGFAGQPIEKMLEEQGSVKVIKRQTLVLNNKVSVPLQFQEKAVADAEDKHDYLVADLQDKHNRYTTIRPNIYTFFADNSVVLGVDIRITDIEKYSMSSESLHEGAPHNGAEKDEVVVWWPKAQRQYSQRLNLSKGAAVISVVRGTPLNGEPSDNILVMVLNVTKTGQAPANQPVANM